MSFKPGELFFTVVEFFSVIVPGAMILALLWEGIQFAQYIQVPQNSFAEAMVFLLLAYLLGQIITAFASRLDKLYDKVSIPRGKRQRNTQLATLVRQAVKTELKITALETDSILEWTDAILRSTGVIDISHIEHLEAESKFFRSMLLVLPLYVILFIVNSQTF